ncbi:acyltransferase family protein [Methylocystis parvus]|nr:acyltransferase [Methylocystis parvus]WBJ98774.1 acyltransferase [Methylocystis parvus OBBP]
MVSKRYLALDGLRGVAALAVIFYHAPWTTHFSNLEATRNAYLAVDFFFILSGFVIAANYARNIADGRDLRVFLTKRFFRLYPLHFAILAALVGLEILKWAAQSGRASDVAPFTGPNSLSLLFENLLMLQGLGLESRLGWNPPAWSVGAECVAYLLFAAAAIAGQVRRSASVVAICVLSLGAYLLIALFQKTLDATFIFGLVRCVAGFSLGVAVWLYSPAAWRAAPLVATVAALLALTVAALAPGGETVAIIPLFVALTASLQYDRGLLAERLSTPAIQFLGRASYSIYLTHMPIFYIFTIVLKRVGHVPFHAGAHGQILDIGSPWTGDLLFAGVVGVTLMTSWATYRLIEEPGRRFGARIAQSLASRTGRQTGIEQSA